ncbi:MAG: acyltransferase, partial [Bacteroidia bacterium]
MKNFIVKSLKSLVGKLYLMGVFNVLFTQKNNLEGVNISRGANSFIDPSAILITNKDGEIVLEGENYIGRNVEIGTAERVKIGSNSSIQDRCILLGEISIGNFCIFAPNVYLSSGRHHYNYKPSFYIKDQDSLVVNNPDLHNLYSKPIIIEDDCWLGINVVVMSGIKIGKGSIIGANSVITKNVEPFSIMGGAPAKLIKKRIDFSPKKKIKYNNDEDLPHFYKGFFVDLKNLNIDRANNGIATSNTFTLHLFEGKKIKLVLKNI